MHGFSSTRCSEPPPQPLPKVGLPSHIRNENSGEVCPLGFSEGAKGDDVLRLDIPETLFTSHEFVPEGDDHRAYREALIPAALLNAYAPFTLLSEEEVDELEANDPRFQL